MPEQNPMAVPVRRSAGLPLSFRLADYPSFLAEILNRRDLPQRIAAADAARRVGNPGCARGAHSLAQQLGNEGGMELETLCFKENVVRVSQQPFWASVEDTSCILLCSIRSSKRPKFESVTVHTCSPKAAPAHPSAPGRCPACGARRRTSRRRTWTGPRQGPGGRG